MSDFFDRFHSHLQAGLRSDYDHAAETIQFRQTVDSIDLGSFLWENYCIRENEGIVTTVMEAFDNFGISFVGCFLRSLKSIEVFRFAVSKPDKTIAKALISTISKNKFHDYILNPIAADLLNESLPCLSCEDIECSEKTATLISHLCTRRPANFLEQNLTLLATISRTFENENSEVMLRFLSLFSHLASFNEITFQICRKVGIVDQIIAACRAPDALMQVVALENLHKLAATKSGLQQLYSLGVIDWLIQLSRAIDEEVDPTGGFCDLLSPQALRELSHILSISCLKPLPSDPFAHYHVALTETQSSIPSQSEVTNELSPQQLKLHELRTAQLLQSQHRAKRRSQLLSYLWSGFPEDKQIKPNRLPSVDYQPCLPLSHPRLTINQLAEGLLSSCHSFLSSSNDSIRLAGIHALTEFASSDYRALQLSMPPSSPSSGPSPMRALVSLFNTGKTSIQSAVLQSVSELIDATRELDPMADTSPPPPVTSKPIETSTIEVRQVEAPQSLGSDERKLEEDQLASSTPVPGTTTEELVECDDEEDYFAEEDAVLKSVEDKRERSKALSLLSQRLFHGLGAILTPPQPSMSLLLKLARQPVTETRFPAMSIMRAVADHHSWGLSALLGTGGPSAGSATGGGGGGNGGYGFRAYLLEDRLLTEFTKEGKEWKYSVIRAVERNPQTRAGLMGEGVAEKLHKMVLRGPNYVEPNVAGPITMEL